MQNLHLELKPSRYLFFVILTLHIGAIHCILFADLNDLWKAVCISITITSILVFYFKPQRWKYLSWHKKEGWKLANARQNISVQLKGDSIRTRWLIILNFRYKCFPYSLSLTLFPDTISYENFRRLQVILLTGHLED